MAITDELARSPSHDPNLVDDADRIEAGLSRDGLHGAAQLIVRLLRALRDSQAELAELRKPAAAVEENADVELIRKLWDVSNTLSQRLQASEERERLLRDQLNSAMDPAIHSERVQQIRSGLCPGLEWVSMSEASVLLDAIDASARRERQLREALHRISATHDGFEPMDLSHGVCVSLARDALADSPAHPLSEPAIAPVSAQEMELREALQQLYSETEDYITINHLGPVHWNRSMQLARAALAASPAPLPPNHVRNFYPASPAPVESGKVPVAWVPVHPRTGPLWANTVASLDADRPASYPVMPLYSAPVESARTCVIDGAPGCGCCNEKALWPDLVASPAAVESESHSDDIAVDRFAAAMKLKLAKKRSQGRGGWEDPAVTGMKFLVHMLREHVEKGDPVDVGNFAMMIWNRRESALDNYVEKMEQQDQHEPVESERERPKVNCEKCGGAGWLRGSELDSADEDTRNDTMTKYSCDGEAHNALPAADHEGKGNG